jgi:NADH:ubiquinone oxidoreductase subunit D
MSILYMGRMTEWLLELQILVQSVPITTKSCEFQSRSWRNVLYTTLCENVYQWSVPYAIYILSVD